MELTEELVVRTAKLKPQTVNFSDSLLHALHGSSKSKCNFVSFPKSCLESANLSSAHANDEIVVRSNSEINI